MAARLASSFKAVKRLMKPANPAASMPEITPPAAMAVSDKPENMKPTATPGSTAWLMASPSRLMRRSVRKTPSGAALTASASVATSARRMKANSENGPIT